MRNDDAGSKQVHFFPCFICTPAPGITAAHWLWTLLRRELSEGKKRRRWGRRRRSPAKAKRKPREKPPNLRRRGLAGTPRSSLPKTTSTPFWYLIATHQHNIYTLHSLILSFNLHFVHSWAYKRKRPRRRKFTSKTTFPRLPLAPTVR